MSVALYFQYNFNFFLPTLPSINTQTFLSHNFQCNFNFVFSLNILVKVLCLMIISFHSLICVQLTKATLILKRREYIVCCLNKVSLGIIYMYYWSYMLHMTRQKSLTRDQKVKGCCQARF